MYPDQRDHSDHSTGGNYEMGATGENGRLSVQALESGGAVLVRVVLVKIGIIG